MIAVDTNVLVRLLTQDDPKQAAAARSVFEQEPIGSGPVHQVGQDGILRAGC